MKGRGRKKFEQSERKKKAKQRRSEFERSLLFLLVSLKLGFSWIGFPFMELNLTELSFNLFLIFFFQFLFLSSNSTKCYGTDLWNWLLDIPRSLHLTHGTDRPKQELKQLHTSTSRTQVILLRWTISEGLNPKGHYRGEGRARSFLFVLYLKALFVGHRRFKSYGAWFWSWMKSIVRSRDQGKKPQSPLVSFSWERIKEMKQ